MFGESNLVGMGALVTGGYGGIATACARGLLRDGAILTLLGRDQDKLAAAATGLSEGSGGAQVRHLVGDASDPGAVAAAAEMAAEAPLGLRITVATVGGAGDQAPVLLLDAEQMLDRFQRNAVTAMLAIRHSAPHMARVGGGSVVCISSIAAAVPSAFLAAYAAAKAALEAVVMTAAEELGSLGIRVNAVRPGLTRSNPGALAERLFDPLVLRAYVDQTALRRPQGGMGVAEDVAAAVRFLAGPESSWITGQAIAVDGGQHLRRLPYLDASVRATWGDAAIEAALRGEVNDQQ